MLDPAQLARVVDLLEQRFGLEALLLFGSEARGESRVESDVDLGTASPILAMQVLRDGRCISGARERALAESKAILTSRYADLRRVRAQSESALVDRMTRGRS